ncbi:hypothetical protein D3C83_03630 [compost metagenome]
MGPKKVGNVYARIVSQRDGSGRIEKFDFASQTWCEAPGNVTFDDVWSAPMVQSALWTEIVRGRAR